ncbi:MAG: hypothetical protein ACFFD4_32470 [Candidatus Odinarchaeota archaeon]
MLFDNRKLSFSANQLLNSRLTNLRPDIEGEKRIFTNILEQVRHQLQATGYPFNQADFQIAGSFAKNTMLTSHREFDIIVTLPANLSGYLPSADTKDQLREDIASVFSSNDPFIPPNGKNTKITVSNISVDVLPTFDIPLNDFLRLPSRSRDPYKGYMSLYHINFMRNRGNLYQDCCRLAKYWSHGPAHKEYKHYASSWFLELVTASSYQYASQKTYSVVFELFLRRMKNIKRRRRRRNKFIAFNDFYKVTPALRDAYLSTLTILEPTDPDDNLATRGIQADHLGELVRKARTTLKTWKNEGFDRVFQEYFSRKA